MFTVFFSDKPVRDYCLAELSNSEHYAKFFSSMLERGVLFPPSQFEAGFLSTVHTDKDVAATVANCGQIRFAS